MLKLKLKYSRKLHSRPRLILVFIEFDFQKNDENRDYFDYFVRILAGLSTNGLNNVK